MTSFLPSWPQAQSHQHRTTQRPSPGLAGQHDAVEHQRLVAPLEGAGVERRDGLIEALRHPAHRRRADRPAEQTKQDLAELASRKPEHETRQDRAVDLGRTPGVGAHHFGRAVAARARHKKFDVAEFGQQRAPVIAVAAIGGVLGFEALQPAIDRRRHLRLDDLGQSLPAKRTIALAPIQPLSLHGLHHLESSR